MAPKQILTPLIAFIIFVFGLCHCYYHGAKGLHPLDSGIVFEGAARLEQGQTIGQHFVSPNGFVPMAIQSVLFKLFGVNWWTYKLHAALFNGIFGCYVFWILLMCGLREELSGALALFSTIVFYPPMAVPYMDQHAFFFLLLGVAFSMAAMQGGKYDWAWLTGVPLACMLAILSKQNPGFLAPLPCALVLVAFPKRAPAKKVLLGLGLGVVAATIAFLYLSVSSGMPLEEVGQMWRYFWQYPSQIGAERAAAWTAGPMKTLRTLAYKPYQVLSPDLHFQFRYLLYFPFLIFLVAWMGRKWKGLDGKPTYPIHLLILAAGLTFVSSFFVLTTQNQMENGICLSFLCIGLGLKFWQEWLPSPFYWLGRGNWGPWASRIFSMMILAACIWAAIRFDFKVNQPRAVLDFEAGRKAGMLNEPRDGISGLAYQAPYHASLLDPGLLLAWMRRQSREMLYFGDLAFLQGMAGKKSLFPAVWIHPGLSMPPQGSPEFEQFDLWLLMHLQQSRPGFAIFEGPSRTTYMGLQWECLPYSSKWVGDRKLGHFNLGGYEIWRLRR